MLNNKYKINFINKSNNIHSNKYDYSLVDYVNNKTKVQIICPEHGVFEQRPDDHSNGRGCSICGGKLKLGTKEIINKFKKIHGNRYDYSLVDYKNSKTKVKIICHIHGVFEQRPPEHIKGFGCSKCSGLSKKTTKEFILSANKIHNNMYDYSMVNYINSHTKVKIVCKEHGDFCVTPNNHLNKKSGCPDCKESKGEKEIKKILESNNIKYEVQKSFDGCKNINKLKFDFYLPDYNTCVEFDGEQHFVKYRFEKNDDRLKIRQKRDKIKNEYCKENNIELIRIKYNEKIQQYLYKIKDYLD